MKNANKRENQGNKGTRSLNVYIIGVPEGLGRKGNL